MNSLSEQFKSDFGFCAEDLQPEEKLIAAIIVHALLDASRVVPPKPTDKRYHYRWLERINEIQEARQWLFSKDCEYYIYLFGYCSDIFQ